VPMVIQKPHPPFLHTQRKCRKGGSQVKCSEKSPQKSFFHRSATGFCASRRAGWFRGTRRASVGLFHWTRGCLWAGAGGGFCATACRSKNRNTGKKGKKANHTRFLCAMHEERGYERKTQVLLTQVRMLRSSRLMSQPSVGGSGAQFVAIAARASLQVSLEASGRRVEDVVPDFSGARGFCRQSRKHSRDPRRMSGDS
jgi:hypothetical protein